MNGACSTHRRDEKRIQTSRGEHAESLGAHERIILDWILGTWEAMDRMHLVQGRDRWRTVVNTVMNFRVPQKVGNFLIS
jgi:hypothetical protein